MMIREDKVRMVHVPRFTAHAWADPHGTNPSPLSAHGVPPLPASRPQVHPVYLLHPGGCQASDQIAGTRNDITPDQHRFPS
jgi:hypothetical protein